MLIFDVNEFFSFGSPLSLIFAYRKMMNDTGNVSFSVFVHTYSYVCFFFRYIKVVRPCCGQLYNLFHACDPNASRIEPLIQLEFSQIPPCCIPRYSQFPLGDGESTLLSMHCLFNSFLF